MRIHGSIDRLAELAWRQDVFFDDATLTFFVIFCSRQFLNALGDILHRQVVAARVKADRGQSAKTLVDRARPLPPAQGPEPREQLLCKRRCVDESF